MKDTPDAPATAKAELEKLGPLSLDEKITAGAFAVTVGLWIFGGSLGINAVAAALLGLSILLITNVVKWKDCLGDSPAAQHMSCNAWHQLASISCGCSLQHCHRDLPTFVIIIFIIHARKDQVPVRCLQVQSAVSKQVYQKYLCTTNMQLSTHLSHCRMSCFC